jgi:hypothetical protein
VEHPELIARLLNELAAARASIAASYLRLWPSERRARLDRPAGSAGETLAGADPPATTDRGSTEDG